MKELNPAILSKVVYQSLEKSSNVFTNFVEINFHECHGFWLNTKKSIKFNITENPHGGHLHNSSQKIFKIVLISEILERFKN